MNEQLTLVLGGTGKTGKRILEHLRQRGVATRVGSRSANPAFDWDRPEHWPAVLDGVNSVYISYAPDLAVPGAVESIRSFVQLAKQKGVQKLVLLSGRGEEEAQRCEGIVQQSGIDWTVVRASWFNQNFSEGAFTEMVLNGCIVLPAGSVPEPFVDADDIAEVAVTALTEPGHAGQVYEVTGPRPLSFDELASEISTASGREVRFESISLEAFAEGLAAAGASPQEIWLMDYLMRVALDGRNAQVCDGVQRALGRPAKDFADYAREVALSGAWATQAA